MNWDIAIGVVLGILIVAKAVAFWRFGNAMVEYESFRWRSEIERRLRR